MLWFTRLPAMLLRRSTLVEYVLLRLGVKAYLKTVRLAAGAPLAAGHLRLIAMVYCVSASSGACRPPKP
jgi:hypothetical protein